MSLSYAQAQKRFFTVLLELYQEGRISYLQHHGEGCAIISTSFEHHVCGEIAKKIGGRIWPSGTGFTWTYGKHVFYALTYDAREDVFKSRAICKKFGLDCGWSHGNASRKLWQYIGHTGEYSSICEEFLDGVTQGYFHCLPKENTSAAMYDVKSYYYTMLCRLDNLDVMPLEGEVCWGITEPDVMERFRDVVAEIGDCKMLRNSFAGSAAGSIGGTPYYNKNGIGHQSMAPSNVRGIGLLIIRSAYEITQQAARQSNSIYTALDCVITEEHKSPEIWRALEFETKCQGRGETSVYNLGTYKCGHKDTVFYRMGDRTKLECDLDDVPDNLYFRQWL